LTAAATAALLEEFLLLPSLVLGGGACCTCCGCACGAPGWLDLFLRRRLRRRCPCDGPRPLVGAGPISGWGWVGSVVMRVLPGTLLYCAFALRGPAFPWRVLLPFARHTSWSGRGNWWRAVLFPIRNRKERGETSFARRLSSFLRSYSLFTASQALRVPKQTYWQNNIQTKLKLLPRALQPEKRSSYLVRENPNNNSFRL
jgi:hypothetical protein